MINKIYKYAIPAEDSFKILMPKDAKILSVQTQDGMPHFWAEVNPEAEQEERNFEMFGTGHEISYDMGVERKYIGTFQVTGKRVGGAFLVFHLYERIN